MQSEWRIKNYPIKQHADGQILTERVRGQTRAGFGVHRTARGWSITQLKSGWATFICGTEEGARIIADYLSGNYADEFERLNIRGCTVENYRTLAERIGADEALRHLRRFYAVPQRELNRRRREAQPQIKIIS